MRLSARTRYACLAVLQLAVDFGESRPARLRSLSTRQAIPEGFLVQILQDLRRAGLVVSTRGAGGGYQLTRPPDAVSVGEVIDAVEGRDGACDRAATTPLGEALESLLRDLERQERDRLAETMLSDLIAEAAPIDSPMWYI